MFFNTPFSRDSSLYLTLLTCADKSSIAELDKKDNVVILNPDYIISSYHILIGVNRAFYNITMKKTKSKLIKKEIIHCMTSETKLDERLHLHSIANNTDGNYYVIFINYKQSEIMKEISALKGNEISAENYSKFINETAIMDSFGIKESEIEKSENGLCGAVYNRIATKELK